MRNIKVKRLYIRICIVIACIVLSSNFAFAIAGEFRHKSVTIHNAHGVECYITIFKTDSGFSLCPCWNGDMEEACYSGKVPNIDSKVFEYDIWEKFAQYTDSDGYKFCQEGQHVTQSTTWEIYRQMNPIRFKFVLYFPEYDTFAVTPKLRPYSYFSNYTIDLDKVNFNKTNKEIQTIDVSKDYFPVITFSAMRIIITTFAAIALSRIGDPKTKRTLFGSALIIQIIHEILCNHFLYVSEYSDAYLGSFIKGAVFVALISCIQVIIVFASKNTSKKALASKVLLVNAVWVALEGITLFFFPELF